MMAVTTNSEWITVPFRPLRLRWSGNPKRPAKVRLVAVTHEPHTYALVDPHNPTLMIKLKTAPLEAYGCVHAHEETSSKWTKLVSTVSVEDMREEHELPRRVWEIRHLDHPDFICDLLIR